MVGHGKFQKFLFDEDELAKELWRLSLGIGYRIGRNVLLKAEYTFENGTQANGGERNKENFIGVEAAVRF